jgi:hypothetical protein
MMMRLTLWFLTSTGPMPVERLVPPNACAGLAPQIAAVEVLQEHPTWQFTGRYTCARHKEMRA